VRSPAVGASLSQVTAIGVWPTESVSGSLAERAYFAVRGRLLTLAIPPGAPIQEDRLCSELGLGRTPVREAIKRLEAEHLVVVYPRRGTFATEIDISDHALVADVRRHLESMAAERAASYHTRADEEALSALRSEIGAATAVSSAATGSSSAASSSAAVSSAATGTGRGGRGVGARGAPGGPAAGRGAVGPAERDALMALDARLHQAVYRATRNPYLEATLGQYYNLALRLWYVFMDRLDDVAGHVGGHAALIDALLAGDGAAASRLAAEHVEAFERAVLEAELHSEVPATS
jgi:DNA-binding GntR family transcriptional regulator